MSKKCTKCNIIKTYDNYNKNKSSKDGYRYECIECRKKYNILNKDKRREYNLKYWELNKSDLIEKNKTYRKNNNEKIKNQKKIYRSRPEIIEHIKIKNKEFLPIKKERIKVKRKNDKNFQLSEILRSKIHKMIKGKNTSYVKYIGCNIETLKHWLEKRFNEYMNWDNLGSYWHIDHIIPINSFNFSNEQEKYICFNWKNLQPLESKENISKSNKIIFYYIMNNIICAHRYINKYLNNNQNEYQGLRETLNWLRINHSGMALSK